MPPRNAACRAALQAGARRAEACRAQGLILGAALVCQGQLVEVGVPALGAPDVSRPVAELVQ
mgnify:CR=1 FL=1